MRVKDQSKVELTISSALQFMFSCHAFSFFVRWSSHFFRWLSFSRLGGWGLHKHDANTFLIFACISKQAGKFNSVAAAGFQSCKMSKKKPTAAFIHCMIPISTNALYVFACVWHYSRYIFVYICFCACAFHPKEIVSVWKRREECVGVCVGVCVSLIFPGLHSKVALGTTSPGCNSLIVELFTLHTHPLHPHFGRVPLPLAQFSLLKCHLANRFYGPMGWSVCVYNNSRLCNQTLGSA